MGLSGAWANQFTGLAEWMAGGDDAEVLVPVAGGDNVTFKHGGVTTDVEMTEAGAMVRMARLAVATQEELTLGAAYTYDGDTWTVDGLVASKVVGTDSNYHYELVRHVS